MLPKELMYGLSPEDIERILAVEHSDPHSVLGAHPIMIDGGPGVVVRAFYPDAMDAEVVEGGERVPMHRFEASGLF